MKKKKAIKVQAVKSFIDIIGDKKYRVEQDQQLNLPEGASWLDVGFVVPVKEQEFETATKQPAERAVTRSKSNGCQGLTKKGSQCRNKALLDSGFCKAHQPKAVDQVMRTTQK